MLTGGGDTKATAKVFALNGTKTGHSGYFNSTSNDTVDWYKITTTNAGSLAFTINVGGGTTGSFDFLDNNGSTLITGTVTGSTGTLIANGIGKGTWYLRIRPGIANGYFGYQVSNAFTASPVPGDVEPNNDLGSAKVVNLNDSVTGNVGYYYNLQRDIAMKSNIESAIVKGIDPMSVRCAYGASDAVCVVYTANLKK